MKSEATVLVALRLLFLFFVVIHGQDDDVGEKDAPVGHPNNKDEPIHPFRALDKP